MLMKIVLGSTSGDNLADLEDGSRHNNIKICGIAESVQALELPSYIRNVIKKILLELKNIKLGIDRVHRLLKPPFLPDSVPRDVILCIHFYHVKEQLMHQVETLGSLPDPYLHLQLFAELSQHTLQHRRQLWRRP